MRGTLWDRRAGRQEGVFDLVGNSLEECRLRVNEHQRNNARHQVRYWSACASWWQMSSTRLPRWQLQCRVR